MCPFLIKVCPAVDETAVEGRPPSSCEDSLLGPCGETELRPRLQHHGRRLSEAVAGLRGPSPATVRHHRSGSLHRVGHPGLPLGRGRALRPHGQTSHAARRVHPQRQVPPAVLGQELCRVAAVLLPPAEPGPQGAAELGGRREAALAAHSECGFSAFKSRTEAAHGAPRLLPQVRTSLSTTTTAKLTEL